MSHTPGPWTWDYDGLHAGQRDVISLGDDGGCSDPECCGGASYHIEVSQDDAALIAAAPDLLAALRVVFVRMREREVIGFAVDEYQAVEAAIAKAEGQ